MTEVALQGLEEDLLQAQAGLEAPEPSFQGAAPCTGGQAHPEAGLQQAGRFW